MNSTLTLNQQAIVATWQRAHHLPPLGYVCRDRTAGFVPDAVVFPIVRQIWNLALDGKTITEILIVMDEQMGFRTPIRGKTGGRPLSRMGVRNILRDPTYTGRIRWHGELYPAPHQPIVSDDEFSRVQWLLTERRTAG